MGTEGTIIFPHSLLRTTALVEGVRDIGSIGFRAEGPPERPYHAFGTPMSGLTVFWYIVSFGFRVFRALGFRVLGFRVVGFRV